MKQDILIIPLRVSQSEEVHSLFAQNAVTSELVNDIPMALRQLAVHTPAFLWIDLEMETARLEQLTKIMRKKEARAENAGQGGGRRRADARQGQQRSHAFSEPLIFSQYFGVLL